MDRYVDWDDFMVEVAANTPMGPIRDGLVPCPRAWVPKVIRDDHDRIDGTCWLPYGVLFPIDSTLDWLHARLTRSAT